MAWLPHLFLLALLCAQGNVATECGEEDVLFQEEDLAEWSQLDVVVQRLNASGVEVKFYGKDRQMLAKALIKAIPSVAKCYNATRKDFLLDLHVPSVMFRKQFWLNDRDALGDVQIASGLNSCAAYNFSVDLYWRNATLLASRVVAFTMPADTHKTFIIIAQVIRQRSAILSLQDTDPNCPVSRHQAKCRYQGSAEVTLVQDWSQESTITLTGMRPGTAYDCLALVEYADHDHSQVWSQFATVVTQDLRMQLIAPQAHNLTVTLLRDSSDAADLITDLKLFLHFRPTFQKDWDKFTWVGDEQQQVLPNLDLDTEYEVCLASEWGAVCRVPDDCCDTSRTLSGPPSAPHNLQVQLNAMKNVLVAVWSAPRNPSGREQTVRVYDYELRKQCIQHDPDCDHMEGCPDARVVGNTTAQPHVTIHLPELNWSYRLRVRAVSSVVAKDSGPWSSWSRSVKSVSYSNEASGEVNFQAITYDQSIRIDLRHHCPYPGPYFWHLVLCQEAPSRLLTTASLSFSLDNAYPIRNQSSHVFDRLPHGGTFTVCVQKSSSSFLSRSCSLGTELQTCKINLKTSCTPLPAAKDTPQQVGWTRVPDAYGRVHDNFDPFTQIKVLLKKGTFDGAISGLDRLDVRCDDRLVANVTSLKWDLDSYAIVTHLLPGRAYNIWVIGHGCEGVDRATESVSMSTQPVEWADIQQETEHHQPSSQGKEIVISMRESVMNLRYGQVLDYSIGQLNLTEAQLRKIGLCQEDETTIFCVFRYNLTEQELADSRLRIVIRTNRWYDGLNEHLFVLPVSLGRHQSHVGVAVGVVVVLVLVAVTVVLIIRKCQHHRLFFRKSRDLDYEIRLQPTYHLSGVVVPRRPLTYEQLESRMLSADFSVSIRREFQELNHFDETHLVPMQTFREARRWNGASPPGSNGGKSMNRYNNILPNDATRVVLMSGVQGSDYINASWIRGYNNPKAYIATQGPLKHTVQHLWQMVLENNIELMVMVTKLTESSKGNVQSKCAQYWPNKGLTQMYGNIEVKNAGEKMENKLVSRTFLVSRSGRKSLVTHLQYLDWPDFGVPRSTKDLLDLHQTMRRHKQRILNAAKAKDPLTVGPVLIHCSAGVGRTGTLIALDTIVDSLELDMNLPQVDIFNTVLEMRKDRSLMVQKLVQYEYLHKCVLMLLKELRQNGEYFSAVDVEYFYT